MHVNEGAGAGANVNMNAAGAAAAAAANNAASVAAAAANNAAINIPARRRRCRTRRAVPPVGLFDLVYGEGNKVLLTELHPRVKAVVHAAYHFMEVSIYLIDSYPDSSPHLKICFLLDMLKRGAADADEQELLEKMDADANWTREIMTLVSSCLC